MKPRYIDAEKLKRQMGVLPMDWGTRDEMWMRERDIAYYIDTCPEADVVEVVRCKDCKFRNIMLCKVFGIFVRSNFFCQDGQRKEIKDNCQTCQHEEKYSDNFKVEEKQ